MSGTRRTPLARRSAVQITPRAVELYVAMGKLRCTCPPPPPDEYWKRKMCAGCERWYELHAELNDELHCQPWEWPCVARQSPKRAGSTCWNDDIAARMALLNAAASKSVKLTNFSKADERGTDAESVTGQEPGI